MNFSYLRFSLFIVPLVCVFSGCVGPNKPNLQQKLPVNWETSLPKEGLSISLNSWWKIFNAPELDILVNDALNKNLDIAQANQLLLKARKLNSISKSLYLPNFSVGVKPVQDAAARENYLHASVDMIWEVSLYGESANQQQAGNSIVLSAEAHEQGVRIAIIAKVVESYLRYIYANQQADQLMRQLAVESRLQQLIVTRKKAHVAVDEEEIKSKLRETRLRDSLLDLQQVREQSSRTLALLTGETLAQINQQLYKKNISIQKFRIEQLPADLLRTRPDIRQAEADVLQAAADVGLARAALYPRLTLSGSLLYSYNLTDNYHNTNGKNTLGFGPIVDIPLWDWGQRRAVKEAKEYELQAALFGYRKAVLESISETEDALSSLAYQDKHIQSLNKAIDQQNHLKQMQSTLNKLGLSSEYDGLNAQVEMFSIESEITEAQFKKAMILIILSKALGGAPLTNMTTSLSSQSHMEQNK